MKDFITDTEMKKLELEGIAKSPQFISDEEMNKMSAIKKDSFLEKYQPMLDERTKKLQEISDANTRGEQGELRSSFQVGGQLLGAAFDPFFAGAKAYLPETIKKPIRGAFGLLGKGIGTVADVISDIPAVQRFAMTPQSEITERDIEAINEYLVLLAPEAKGTSKIFSKLSTEAGIVAEESGKKSLSTLRANFVRNLTRPEKTPKIKLAEVKRTSEIGTGAFKRSIIEPTIQESRSIQEVLKISEVSKNKTFQQNYNVISEANIKEAKKLSDSLVKNDFIYPKKELISRLNQTKIQLAENPMLVGDASKTADKMLVKVEQLINESPAKGSELLNVRKLYDRWIESQKGQGIFDPVRENAISISNREIRQTINTFLDEKATNIAVRESLKKQSSLYNALDNIAPKAAKEADAAIMRAFQRMGQILGTKSRLVQIVAAMTGIGGLGAAATFAPAALGVGAITFVMYQGGKLILKPQLRLLLGITLKTVGKVLNKEDINIIKSLLLTESVIQSNSEIQKIK